MKGEVMTLKVHGGQAATENSSAKFPRPPKKQKAGLPIGKNHHHGNPASMSYSVTLILRQLSYPMDFKKLSH